MDSIKRTARVAGLYYLLVVITGAIELIYIPGRLIVRGNATETAARFLAAPGLVRLGVLNGVVSLVLFVLLVLKLRDLLHFVSAGLARLMVVLVVVQVPAAFVGHMFRLAALAMFDGVPYLAVFEKAQRDALAMLLVSLDGEAQAVSFAWWGLWLFPLGVLAWRSGILPRVLGAWLLVNGAAYVALCVVGLAGPEHAGLAAKVTAPALLGEPLFALWLLTMGARPRPVTPAAAAVAVES